jgi:hypothetical protein
MTECNISVQKIYSAFNSTTSSAYFIWYQETSLIHLLCHGVHCFRSRGLRLLASHVRQPLRRFLPHLWRPMGLSAPLLHQHSASPVIPDLPPPRHLECLSLPAIHGVVIKSQFPYTLDLQAHNYIKWHTLFSMVLGRFNLLHHVEDDATYPDLEWTKENLLVGQWIYSTISENLFDSA